MRYGTELLDSEFIVRNNRFSASVVLDGTEERVHVPNSGRMRELLYPGATVLLLPASSPGRKTSYDLVAVETSKTRVSVDSRVPNAVVAEALANGQLQGINGYETVHAEHRWGSSRYDFHLGAPEGEALIEVKGCTLVEDDGLALFPDAPTTRGARHVRELGEAVRQGLRAYIVIIVQRSDGRVFSPNERTDPAFAKALREASDAGVEVMAFLTDVTRSGVDLGTSIPVDLNGAKGVIT